MLENYRSLYLFIFLLSLANKIHSQDIAKALKSDFLTGSGNISSSHTYNTARGKPPSRLPYSFIYSGSIDFKILGEVSAPFNFVFSNLGNSYTQPTFNQTSLHPGYKWATLHLGSIAPSFSSYTVSGHMMNAVAIDLSPGKFSFSAFYGRLRKAVSYDTNATSENLTPVYQRKGYGLKASFRTNKSFNIGLILFSALDKERSILYTSTPPTPNPQANNCAGINIQAPVYKRLSLSTEVAISAYTENILAAKSSEQRFKHMHTNSTTGIYKALKSSVDYKVGQTGLQLGYERIDPFYKTMGAYYFNNDLENITVSIAQRLLRQKLNINITGGMQHDDLDKTKIKKMTRFVNNTNISYTPYKSTIINASYSDFLNYTNTRPLSETVLVNNPYTSIDTFSYRQISRNITCNLNQIIKSDSIKNQAILLTLCSQTSADLRNDILQNSNTFTNGSIGYTHHHKKKAHNILLSLNLSQSELNNISIINLSPCFSYGRPLVKQGIKASFTAFYTNSFISGQFSGGTLNTRLQTNFTIAKKHNISFSAYLLQRQDQTRTSHYESGKQFRELTITVNYTAGIDLFTIKNNLSKQ